MIERSLKSRASRRVHAPASPTQIGATGTAASVRGFTSERAADASNRTRACIGAVKCGKIPRGQHWLKKSSLRSDFLSQWHQLTVSFPLILGALFLLAGCEVGPNYHRPITEAPANWRWLKVQADSAVLDDRWWKSFNDAKLEELESMALEANQDIKLAVARVDEARALARVAKADFYPQISFNPSFQRSETSGASFIPGSTGGTIPGIRNPHNDFNLPLNLSFEADVWGRVRRSLAAGRDRAEASVADYRTVILTVTSDLASNYFLLHALDAETDVLQNTLKLRGESLKLVASQFKFGAIDALNVSRAKTDVSTTLAGIADVKRRREQASNVLAILCGKAASDFSVEFKPLAIQPPEIPAGLPSALLERRPDVTRAERTLAAFNEDVGVAKTAFLPRFALTSSAGFESQDLTSLFNWPSTVWAVAFNMAQPVFTGGRNKAQLEAARARYDQATAQYKQQVLIAFKDVEDALLDIQFLAEQAKALSDAVDESRQVTKLATIRYEKGQVSYLDVVDAQRIQLGVEQQATQVLGQRLAASVHLIQALGGGFGGDVCTLSISAPSAVPDVNRIDEKVEKKE